MHPISSMTGFFDLKFCNLIHNSEYISLCILDFCTAVVLKENCCTVKVIALFLHILWYASTYACTHALILHILTLKPHKHTRFCTLHMLNTEKLTHVHNQGLEICLGQPHNDIWHVCGGDMRVRWRLWNRAGGFWLHLSRFFFFTSFVSSSEQRPPVNIQELYRTYKNSTRPETEIKWDV